MLAAFLGLNPKESYLSLEKERENFCLVFIYSIKWASEIGMAKKCTKKRDARAKLLFCLLTPLLLFFTCRVALVFVVA